MIRFIYNQHLHLFKLPNRYAILETYFKDLCFSIEGEVAKNQMAFPEAHRGGAHICSFIFPLFLKYK